MRFFRYFERSNVLGILTDSLSMHVLEYRIQENSRYELPKSETKTKFDNKFLIATHALKISCIFSSAWRNIQILSRWSVNRGYVDTRHARWSVCLGRVFSGPERQAKHFRIRRGSECVMFFGCRSCFFQSLLYWLLKLISEIHRNRCFARWFGPESSTLQGRWGKRAVLLHYVFLMGCCKSKCML